MNKKRHIFLAGILTLSLGVVSISTALVLNRNIKNNIRATNQIEGSIVFENNGTNVSQTIVSEGFYKQVTTAYTEDNNPVYLEASPCKQITGTDRVANLFNSSVYFKDESNDEFLFQEIDSIAVLVEGERNITIEYSNDGTNFNYGYIVTDESGAGSLVLGSARYVRIHYNLSMDLPLFRVTLNYSCSYDYVDPLDPANIKTLTVYAFNDFHGGVVENGEEPGLANFGTYLKSKSNQVNTLLLSQGDDWQGSIYSNMSYGGVVNDVMTYAGLDVRTVGNHDFDWGVDHLKANTAREYGGRTIPVLGANIYDYNFSTKEFGTVQQSEIGGKTAIFNLENGLKVGIVGVIGEDQITSINSIFTQNIGFKNHISIVQEEATNLRNAGCDIVIASCHADCHDSLYNRGLYGYVDLVLGGHVHQYEHYYESDLHFFQFKGEAKSIGEITLSYNVATHKVVNTSWNVVDGYTIKSTAQSLGIDPVIQGLIDANRAECITAGSEVLASNVVSAPLPVGSDFNVGDVYLDTAYSKPLPFYRYKNSEWEYAGKIIKDEDEGGYYYWFRSTAVISGGGLNANHYYIDDETGDYYKANESGEAVHLGCLFADGVDPSTHDFYVNDSTPTLESENRGVHLMAQAIYDEAVAEGFDIDFSYLNYARDTITATGGVLTYEDIYTAFPFDNIIYIIEASGQELYDEVMSWNYACFSDDFVNNGKGFDIDGTYTIAVIDYVAFHTDTNRNYNFFPDNNGNYIDTLDDNYRIILKNWLKDNGYAAGKELNINNYQYYQPKFRKSNMHVTTTYNINFMMNDGTGYTYYTANSVQYGSPFSYFKPYSDPTRSGYEFIGWYYDAACTRPVSSGAKANKDMVTLYAGWSDSDMYSTGQITYTSFTAGSTSTPITATNTNDEYDSINLTLYHSEIQNDFSYSEFRIRSGYVTLTAPSGYVIRTVEAKIYNTYDNLEFYAGTSTAGTHLDKNKSTVSGNLVYNPTVNSSSVYIENTFSGNVAFYYLSFVLLKVS